jgi:sarcosine oxidase subunit delta
MLLIPCPSCGLRPESEFAGGTDTDRVRPGPEAFDDNEAWAAYLFHDAGAPGEREERWCHTHGCGQWFLLERDTETGALGKSSRLAGPPPRPQEAPLTAVEPPPEPTSEPPSDGDGA